MPIINRFDQKKFTQKLVNDVRARYRSVYPKIKSAVKTFVSQELRREFYESDTVQSCINGILKPELGLQEPAANLEAILVKMISTIDISVSAPRDQKGILQITLEAVRKDFEDLLSLAAAQQDWTDATGNEIKGPPLPWLEWLILRGGKVIIRNYVSKVGPILGRSDEPMLMKPAKPGFWKVPSQYQGTKTDNFILDILRNVDNTLEKKLWQIVRPVIAPRS